MSPLIRTNRAIIKIFGADAEKLLNNVLSVKFMNKENEPKWWALLSPKGKILAEGLAIYWQGSFFLDIHKKSVADFLGKMRLYKMRANVDFLDLSEKYVVGWSEKKIETPMSFRDPRDKDLGFHIFCPKEQADNWGNGYKNFSIKRISLAIGELYEDFLPDKLFVHDLGMDILGGVDFTKGCYIGQEIVSRMQHKANIKNRVAIAYNIEGADFSKIYSHYSLF